MAVIWELLAKDIAAERSDVQREIALFIPSFNAEITNNVRQYMSSISLIEDVCGGMSRILRGTA